VPNTTHQRPIVWQTFDVLLADGAGFRPVWSRTERVTGQSKWTARATAVGTGATEAGDLPGEHWTIDFFLGGLPFDAEDENAPARCVRSL
jgi:hypothetical protein